MKLPELFLNQMRELLGAEYEAFEKSLVFPGYRGLRVNTSKTDTEAFQAAAPFPLERIPWIPNGFYLEEEAKASLHPWYAAGLYYLQEPSAMTPASCLPVEEGDRVLDLCAAPGGKATELAARLKGSGLLAANDISNSRAKGLLKNLELSGAANILVTSETPERLASYFEGFFDKILVDAPCSGEGMFRKDSAMVRDWEEKGPAHYAPLQRSILEQAARLLRPGGLLLYSTCTFSPEENEGSVLHLLKARPDFRVLPLPASEGFSPGRPDLLGEASDTFYGEQLARCLRLYPHRIRGEGHFLALLKKEGETSAQKGTFPKPSLTGKLEEKAAAPWKAFASRLRTDRNPENLRLYDGKLYWLPDALLERNIRGLRFLRTGLYLGDLEKNRFVPSQAMAMALRKEDWADWVDLPAKDGRVIRYLKGETLDAGDLMKEEASSGWYLVCTDGFPLGWAKLVNESLRNKYYPGWRWQHASG